jgi:hypothetical protein
MLRKENLIKTAHTLFLILVLIIPLNLGKHFITRDSYVWGMLVDYLIPTIYLQDIVALLVLLFWIIGGGAKKIKKLSLFSRSEFQIATLFIFSCLFSVFSSQRLVPSFYFWLRLLLYFLLFVFILCEIAVERDFFKILNVVSISIIFVSLLGIFQFTKQGSLFNNYYFFGEQPYSVSTYGIAKETFLGHMVLPSYATFRHPNVLGGFLSIFTLWLVPYLAMRRKYVFAFVLSVIALAMTFSVSAWVSFVVGVLIYLFLLVDPKKTYLKKLKISAVVIAFSLAMLIFPALKLFTTSANPSLFRRSDLLVASYRIAGKYPLFGIGINNFTVLVDNFVPQSPDIRFTQPVHNVFALVLSEAGVFSYTLLVLLILLAVRKQTNPGLFSVLFISLMQLLILFSVDHYFFTANQTFLMLWVILGLVFSTSD